jgi:hypothetical protein
MVQVRIDSGDWTEVSGNGAWQYTLDTTGLRNGRHVIQARAFDGVDNSDAVNRTFFVDNPAPSRDGTFTWFWVGLVFVAAVAGLVTLAWRLLRTRK